MNNLFTAFKKRITQSPLYQAYCQIVNLPWQMRQDKKMLSFYSQFIAKNDVVFDIGANMGNRAKIFLQLGAKVIAVEPQSRCIDFLRKSYGHHKNFHLIPAALGKEEKQAELLISDAHTLSSLSTEWIDAVKKSGRFSNYTWTKKEIISMTTLDKIIAQYGAPSFIKIDVEGYERDVIQGLSHPIRVLSIEFAPEFLNSTFACLDHLAGLSRIQANYSLGESFELCLDPWVSASDLKGILTKLPEKYVFGDIYIKTIK